MTATLALALVGVALVAYALTGGADYGAGIWELTARGRQAPEMRAALARAIAPIWEANHVWILFALVLLLTAFPPVIGVLGQAIHVPLGLALIGMTLRGSAFVFRAYGLDTQRARRRWGLSYALSSLITPFFLGVSVGTISSGAIRIRDGEVALTTAHPWAAPFPLTVGVLAIALFAFLAAAYMTSVAPRELRDAFRARAIGASLVAAVAAAIALALSREGAPQIWSGLTGTTASLALHLATFAVALVALSALVLRRVRAAAVAAALQVALVLVGWGLSLDGLLVPPDLSYRDAAAPEPVVRAALAVAAVGVAGLVPALALLARITRRRAAS